MSDELDETVLRAVRPDMAAMILAFGRLVTLLDQQGLLPAEMVATDMENHADALPQQSRQLFLNLAAALRPMDLSSFGLIDGGKQDNDDPTAA